MDSTYKDIQYREEILGFFEECNLCPKKCGINRMDGFLGLCGESNILRVAHLGAHFGEEPPITGTNGSGTVFFTGCSLKCSFCQNYQISKNGLGSVMTLEGLLSGIIKMIEDEDVININFVTPDHFFPYTFLLVRHLRSNNYSLPIIYNLSGYQSIEMLKMTADFADIYLPDFKYSDSSIASNLSSCKDYPEVALHAITEMVQQKGFIDTINETGRHAKKGVLVRHLILPGKIENSLNALTTLFLEFGPQLPLSLMSQYHPVIPHKEMSMNRTLTLDEFNEVYSHAIELGFKHMFVQIPDKHPSEHDKYPLFLPDFRRKRPFSGKKSYY